MSYVFISFSREDREVGLRIVEALGQAGLTVWNEQASQADIPRERESAIDSAQCVIVIWSKAAKEESVAQDEFSEPIRGAIQAWSSGRLVLATLDDTKLPIGLRDLSPIPVKDHTGVARLIANASAIVQRSNALLDAASETQRVTVTPTEKRSRSGRVWGIVATLIATCALVVLGIIGLRSVLPISNTELAVGLIKLAVDPFGDRRQMDPRRLEELGDRLRAEIRALRSAPMEISPQEREAREEAIKSNEDMLELVRAEELRKLIQTRTTNLVSTPDQIDFSLLFLILALMLVLSGIIWHFLAKRRLAKTTTFGVLSTETPEPRKLGTLVFISYSHQDQTLVERLIKQIEELGCAIWIDRKKGGSQRYAGPIVEAIQNSKLVALMCSRNAFLSDHVIREVYIAGKYKKPFIAFRLDSIDIPDELDYFLSGFPLIPVSEVSSEQLRSEIARLITA